MEVREERHGSATVLTLDGRIVGAAESGILMDKLHELIERGEKLLVIDLSHVNAMNSSGLGALISGLNTMRQAGGNLKLTGLTEKIVKLMTITKLYSVFESYATVKEAVDSYHSFCMILPERVRPDLHGRFEAPLRSAKVLVIRHRESLAGPSKASWASRHSAFRQKLRTGK